MDVARYKSSGALSGYPEPPGSNKTQISVICFPFIDIYKAAGLEKLDVLYLDVQGPEFDILRTIPFHLVDIKVNFCYFSVIIELPVHVPIYRVILLFGRQTSSLLVWRTLLTETQKHTLASWQQQRRSLTHMGTSKWTIYNMTIFS